MSTFCKTQFHTWHVADRQAWEPQVPPILQSLYNNVAVQLFTWHVAVSVQLFTGHEAVQLFIWHVAVQLFTGHVAVHSCSLGTWLARRGSYGHVLISCSLGTWLFRCSLCTVQYFFVNWWGSIWTAVRQLAGQVFGCCCYYSTVRQLSGHVFDAAVIFQLSGSCKVTLWMLLSFFSCQAAVLSHFGCCCHSSAVRQLSGHVLDAFVIFQQSGSCLVTFWMLLSLFCCQVVVLVTFWMLLSFFSCREAV